MKKTGDKSEFWQGDHQENSVKEEGLFLVSNSDIVQDIDRLQEHHFQQARESILAGRRAFSKILQKTHTDQVESARATLVQLEEIKERATLLSKAPAPTPRLPQPPKEKMPVLPAPKHYAQLPSHMVWKSIAAYAIIGVGYIALNQFVFNKPADTKKTEVAGVSTERAKIPTLQSQYPESFADLPLEETLWESFSDPELGILMEYPKNVTNKVRITEGNNVWFLRHEGYFFRITRIESGLDLDAWVSENYNEYSETHSLAQIGFKDRPAWIGIAKDTSDVYGNYYFVKNGGAIFRIWVKNNPLDSVDAQRTARMLNSLVFTQ